MVSHVDLSFNPYYMAVRVWVNGFDSYRYFKPKVIDLGIGVFHKIYKLGARN